MIWSGWEGEGKMGSALGRGEKYFEDRVKCISK